MRAPARRVATVSISTAAVAWREPGCCWPSAGPCRSRGRARATTAKGYTSEAKGHVPIGVARGTQALVGAFIAGPAASEAIHEAVLAVKLRTPLLVLADTIHAFPTLARVMGTLFAQAAK